MSLSEALLSQRIDGVARASSAGTKSGSIARSLVLLTILAPVSRSARLGDQLGLDDERNSQIADGGATRAAAFRLAPPSAICQLPASAPVQLIPPNKRVLPEHPPYYSINTVFFSYRITWGNATLPSCMWAGYCAGPFVKIHGTGSD